MKRIKLYINDEFVDIPIISMRYTKNLLYKNTTAQIVVNKISKEFFKEYDDVKLYLYYRDISNYKLIFRGYVARIEEKENEKTVEIYMNSYSFKLKKMFVFESYYDEKVVDIVKDVISKNTPFGYNIENDGEDKQDTSYPGDTEITLNAGEQLAFKITADKPNISKITLYATGGKIDLSIGQEKDIPLKTKSSITLTNGANEIPFTKLTKVGQDYWIIITAKEDTTLYVGGSGSGAVYKYSGGAWSDTGYETLKLDLYYTTSLVLDNYIAKGKSVEVVLDELCKRLVEYVFYIDYDNVIHFKKGSYDDSGIVLTKMFSKKVGADNIEFINRVVVYGGNELHENYEAVIKGDGQTKVFQFSPGRPRRPVKKVYSGSTTYKEGQHFFIDYDKGTITFATAPANGASITILHDYFLPVMAIAENTESIQKIGKQEYVYVDTSIKTKEEARIIANSILKAKGDYRKWRTVEAPPRGDIDVNTKIRLAGEDDSYVVISKSGDFSNGAVETYELINSSLFSTTRIFVYIMRVLENIRIAQSEQKETVLDMKEHKDSIRLSDQNNLEEKSIADTFVLGHPLLGVLGRGKIIDTKTTGNENSGVYDYYLERDAGGNVVKFYAKLLTNEKYYVYYNGSTDKSTIQAKFDYYNTFDDDPQITIPTYSSDCNYNLLQYNNAGKNIKFSAKRESTSQGWGSFPFWFEIDRIDTNSFIFEFKFKVTSSNYGSYATAAVFALTYEQPEDARYAGDTPFVGVRSFFDTRYATPPQIQPCIRLNNGDTIIGDPIYLQDGKEYLIRIVYTNGTETVSVYDGDTLVGEKSINGTLNYTGLQYFLYMSGGGGNDTPPYQQGYLDEFGITQKDTAPVITYGDEETGNWEIDGETYTKRRMIEVDADKTIVTPVELDYSYFNNDKILVMKVGGNAIPKNENVIINPVDLSDFISDSDGTFGVWSMANTTYVNITFTDANSNQCTGSFIIDSEFDSNKYWVLPPSQRSGSVDWSNITSIVFDYDGDKIYYFTCGSGTKKGLNGLGDRRL